MSDDRDQLEETYRKISPNLWRALVAFSGDPDIATDAVAEAFAQALRGGDAIREVDRWVWKVAFRVAAADLKHRSRFSARNDDGTYELDEDAVAVSSLLAQLSPKQRAAVILHYFSDLPNGEIAKILGVTTATVRVHLSQGRKRLKQLLEDER